MTDTSKILHTVEPLTEAEKASRVDHTMTIVIEARSYRPVIRQDWVQSGIEGQGYGYAERRAVEAIDEKKFSLTVPGVFDVAALAAVVLTEITRQSQQQGTAVNQFRGLLAGETRLGSIGQ